MKRIMMALGMGLLGISLAANAKSLKNIEEEISLGEAKHLMIQFPVGSADIEVVNSNKVEVEIELSAKNDSWFAPSVDASDIELEKVIENGQIYLEIDNNDVAQAWVLKIPRSLALEMEVGVGNIEIDGLQNSADIQVGVGAVYINPAIDDFKFINLDAGVGETDISGLLHKASKERSLVTSEASYRGSGKYSIEVEVGVGDVSVSRSP